MNGKPPQDRKRPNGEPKQPDRAAAAARDPGPGSKNRPGFDLGGAIGESDPRNSPPHNQDAVEHESSNAGTRKTTGKSAVAGVRNWLRGN